MQIEELDEAQGLTLDRLREYLTSKHWTRRSTSTGPRWSPPDSSDSWAETQVGSKFGFLLARAVEWQGRSTQAVLREINPRWHLGTPSPEAVRAHGGAWMIWCEPLYPEVVAAAELMRAAARCVGPFRCWPCDAHGNKVRWPTDSSGKML